MFSPVFPSATSFIFFALNFYNFVSPDMLERISGEGQKRSGSNKLTSSGSFLQRFPFQLHEKINEGHRDGRTRRP